MKPQFFTLFSFIFLTSTSPIFATSPLTCPPVKCSPGGPDICYPFRETTHHAPHCGRPGFDLTCKHNTTRITFDNNSLLVKSIDYVDRRVDLLDPRRCVHGVFMELNLTGTRFEYSYRVKDFEYLNCSKRVGGLDEVGCLSGEGSHVYTVEKSSSRVMMPRQICRVVKTVAIPFGYSPYLADDGFGLGLIWTVDDGQMGNGLLSKGLSTNNCIGRVMLCNKWVKVALCLAAAALLVIIKMYYCHTAELERQLDQIEKSRQIAESLKPRGV
ncbi:Putative RING-H2 finger protein ATL21A [Linum perenne]